ncbi:MAG: TolC family protein [Betaproteobacteria bacterium]|nr:TolC family protein [Betaproteobacteria bacterium]
MKRHYLWGLTALSVVALSGCASLSADGGLDQVSQLTRERIAQPVAFQRDAAQTEIAQARVSELLKGPLSVDSAVEMALLSNRDLQAQLANLGIAEADLVRAGRLRNPGFSFGRLSGNGVVEYDRTVMFDLLGLLTMPMARQIEQQRFERAQLQAAQDAVTLAANTRRAYFNAVGAQEQLRYLQQVKETADIANELAKRMAQVGNFNRLTQMREQAFFADTTAQLARAQQQALADRERLTRLLGLTGEQLKFQLPDRLPELPKQALEVRSAEQTAMDKRLDIQIAKRQTEALARTLGLTRSTRLVNVLEVGYQNKSETGAQRSNGYEISLELPIFDFGTARVARAEATYLQSMNRVAALGVQAQSEVRESHAAYLTAYELARHYRDEVVPLRKRISEENLLRYNGMLISVFELLADAREQVTGVSNAVAALRDFWVAQVNLDTALTAGSPVTASVSPISVPANAAKPGH